MASEQIVDLYRVLDIQRDASQEEIKQAYRRALLRHHPDKNRAAAEEVFPPKSVPAIDTVREAFRVLSTLSSRQKYDAALGSQMALSQRPEVAAPRPANIVSLDDFEEKEASIWAHPCRCGGVFVITEDLLEQDVHLIGCDSCSEALWVGYEVHEA
ncbi:hypothetical protein M408DRAFT_325459 [Serendipita vermifera MAFF 305830]|uniref:Diphthamide biosynthesis protein 4 n=1 Tax=Serendipita vermifera MAFF 305830 TaxID=933852 RepID=A0A0C3BR01_SERVB|nr:hypothetical protein M408DRAFT_325459 [Serendipita vermifera MAFF 305830]